MKHFSLICNIIDLIGTVIIKIYVFIILLTMTLLLNNKFYECMEGKFLYFNQGILISGTFIVFFSEFVSMVSIIRLKWDDIILESRCKDE